MEEWRMEELLEKVNRHEKDLYLGDGPRNPSITARLFKVEDQMARILNNSSWTIRLLLSAILAAVADMVMQALRHHA